MQNESADQNRESSSRNNHAAIANLIRTAPKHGVTIFIPVTVCMLLTSLSVRYIHGYQTSLFDPEIIEGGLELPVLIYTPIIEVGSATSKILISLANSLIFIGFVALMTCALILLYRFRCYVIIHGWLAVTTVLLLFVIL